MTSGTRPPRARHDANVPAGPAFARFGDTVAWDLVEVAHDPALLTGGRWAVAIGFEGRVVLARFRNWRSEPCESSAWIPPRGPWATSLDQAAYQGAVRMIQAEIGRGWVYQVNLCRILSTPLESPDLAGLHERLAPMHAWFAGLLHIPELGVHIASASPERYLSKTGDRVWSSPIKGTAATPDGFLAKDRAENIMIVDLVRNDLGAVAETGTVAVDSLLTVEPYPGLYHLVSTVSANVQADWSELLAATFPPGSVTGAPKHSALEVIRRVEPCPREWYCGAFGWIDVDRACAELAVAIRTFWWADGELRFGTGAGITWGSDPAGEWRETELKAARLMELAN